MSLLAANMSDIDMPQEYFVVATVSKILGILSLFVWLFAQIPQVLENHLNQSVDGISPAFLLCWISGDVTNLVGCVLSRALPFQICLAAYYCFIDVILTLQFWYYTHIYPKQRVHHNMLQSPNMMRPVNSRGSGHHVSRTNRFEASTHNPIRSGSRPKSMLKMISNCVLSGSVGKATAMPANNDVIVSDNLSIDITDRNIELTADAATSVGKVKLGVNTVLSLLGLFFQWTKSHYNSAVVGAACGWMSLLLYLSSRAPQIWKNYRSKSTKGVSPFLFLFAMTGNTLYTISIVSDLYLLAKYDQHLGDIRFEDVLRAQLPFIIGSAGTVMFDAVLLFQFWLYRPKDMHGIYGTHEVGHTYGHNNFHNFHNFHNHNYHNYHSEYGAVEPGRRSPAGHFTKPDWYTNNFPTDDEEFHGHDAYASRGHSKFERKPTDTSALMSLAFAIPPPPHYVSSASSHSHTPHRRKGLSGTFGMIAQSFSYSSLMIKSPSVASSAGSVAASPMAGTALLPAIVGTYSSVSKKMMNDAKIPFLPSDFLHSNLGDS